MKSIYIPTGDARKHEIFVVPNPEEVQLDEIVRMRTLRIPKQGQQEETFVVPDQ